MNRFFSCTNSATFYLHTRTRNRRSSRNAHRSSKFVNRRRKSIILSSDQNNHEWFGGRRKAACDEHLCWVSGRDWWSKICLISVFHYHLKFQIEQKLDLFLSTSRYMRGDHHIEDIIYLLSFRHHLSVVRLSSCSFHCSSLPITFKYSHTSMIVGIDSSYSETNSIET